VEIRSNPQRLDTLEGKILRIIPDLNEHTATSTVGENGRYRIPNDNPFVSTAGARKEIWAYGFRNPHRLNWAVDPANPANNRLIVNSVGLQTWETVYLVHKGANYGYALREGNQLLKQDNKTAPLPEVDKIPLQIGDKPTATMVVPTYPVIQYGHDPKGGDSIGSGFVYNGSAIPALRGKYIFTDLTTGRLWYATTRTCWRPTTGRRARWRRFMKCKCVGREPSTTRCSRSSRSHTTRAAERVQNCRAAPISSKAAARTFASRSTRRASCISTARRRDDPQGDWSRRILERSSNNRYTNVKMDWSRTKSFFAYQ
jgi:hypothetical protein